MPAAHLDFRAAHLDIYANPGVDLTWRIRVADEGIVVGTIICTVGTLIPTVDTSDSIAGVLVADITLSDTQTAALGIGSYDWSFSNDVAGAITRYLVGDVMLVATGNSSNGLTALVTATTGTATVETLVSSSAATLAAHLIDPIDAHDASSVSFTPAGTIAATDAQAAIVEVAVDAAALVTAEAGTRASADSALDIRLDVLEVDPTTGAALTAHIVDTVDAHDATAISFAPIGTIAATTTQAAVAEVATDAATALSTHDADTTSVHGITDTSALATTANITTAINALIDAAPGALDTLNELAAALGDDPNFATTVTNALADKQPLDSDLTAIAALATTVYGRSLLTSADAEAARSTLEAQRAMWVNARDHDVLSDGSNDDTAEMQAAVDATPIGGTCVFPIGTGAMRISAPINLLEQRTYVFPVSGRMWPYRYTVPIAGSVKLTAGFAGAAAFLVQGNEITARALDNDGVRIIGLVVDCGAASGNVHGVQVEGLCRDISIVDSAVISARGTSNGFDFRQGTGEAPPRGIRMQNCAAYAGAANGFRFNGVTDSHFLDLLAVSNTGRGIYASNSGENTFTSCRAVFNTVDGWFFDGTTTVGMTTLLAPATDRNGQNGILISQSGTQPIQIVAPRLRRDGSTSTSLNYSGLRLSGSAGLEVVPVDVTIPQVVPGVDDDAGGSQTPQFAVRALRAQRLTIHGGDLWGVSGGFSDGGNNTEVAWSKDTAWYSGAIGAKTVSTPTTIGAKALPVTGGGTGGISAADARTNLGLVIGTDVQAQDGELQAIAGLTSAADRLPYFTGSGTASLATFTAAGRALVDDADNTTQRTTLGLGTIATQAASAVAITGGTITGITDLAVADGGTGASTALAARTSLDVQRRRVFDVREYGADPTGVSDSNTACQAAIDACAAAGGGTVFFSRPAGSTTARYLLSTVTANVLRWCLLVTTDNVWLELDEGVEVTTDENACLVFFAGPGKNGQGFTSWVANRFYPNLTVYPMTGGYAKSATTITLATAGNAANFAPGDLILIRTGQLVAALNDQPDGEVNEVVSVNAGTGVINLLRPLAKPYAQEYFISGTNGKTSTSVTANPAPFGVSNVTAVTLRNVGIRGRGKITCPNLTDQQPFHVYQVATFGMEDIHIVTPRSSMNVYFMQNYWFDRLKVDHTATGDWFALPVGATCQTDGSARDCQITSEGAAFVHIHEGAARVLVQNVSVLNRGTSASYGALSVRGRGYDIKVFDSVFQGNGAQSTVFVDETVTGGFAIDGCNIRIPSGVAVLLGGANQKFGSRNVVEGIVQIINPSGAAVTGPMAPLAVESIANWVSDDNLNPTIGLLPAASFVTKVWVHVTQAFNSSGADNLSIGWDSNNLTIGGFPTLIDVAATGLQSITPFNGGYQTVDHTVEAYYTAGGTAPTTGKALVVVEFYRVPYEVS